MSSDLWARSETFRSFYEVLLLLKCLRRSRKNGVDRPVPSGSATNEQLELFILDLSSSTSLTEDLTQRLKTKIPKGGFKWKINNICCCGTKKSQIGRQMGQQSQKTNKVGDFLSLCNESHYHVTPPPPRHPSSLLATADKAGRF